MPHASDASAGRLREVREGKSAKRVELLLKKGTPEAVCKEPGLCPKRAEEDAEEMVENATPIMRDLSICDVGG
jgi:hypothetical protein